MTKVFPITSGLQISVLTIAPLEIISRGNFEIGKISLSGFFVCLSVTVLKSQELLLAATTMENTSFPLKASIFMELHVFRTKKNI